MIGLGKDSVLFPKFRQSSTKIQIKSSQRTLSWLTPRLFVGPQRGRTTHPPTKNFSDFTVSNPTTPLYLCIVRLIQHPRRRPRRRMISDHAGQTRIRAGMRPDIIPTKDLRAGWAGRGRPPAEIRRAGHVRDQPLRETPGGTPNACACHAALDATHPRHHADGGYVHPGDGGGKRSRS